MSDTKIPWQPFTDVHGRTKDPDPRAVVLTSLERSLVYRAVNTERNLLLRLYGRGDPEFDRQLAALNHVMDLLEGTA
jgi:hypothetical protein